MITKRHTLVSAFIAAVDIPAHRFITTGAVKDDIAIASANNQTSLGVSGDVDVPAGQHVDVVMDGIAHVEFAGTIARGADVTANTDGKAVTAATGNVVFGTALEAGVAGDICAVTIKGNSNAVKA